MEQQKWKLGYDLSQQDNLLDGFTFDDLILAVHCNCRRITPEEVRRTVKEIIDIRMVDCKYLLENNMDEIMEQAMRGRGQYEKE